MCDKYRYITSEPMNRGKADYVGYLKASMKIMRKKIRSEHSPWLNSELLRMKKRCGKTLNMSEISDIIYKEPSQFL